MRNKTMFCSVCQESYNSLEFSHRKVDNEHAVFQRGHEKDPVRVIDTDEPNTTSKKYLSLKKERSLEI